MKKGLAWGVAISFALFLMTYELESVPGLHRDEAAFALFAEKIQAGLRPLRGLMNPYTGPLHTYLIAGAFGIFGESIVTLRSIGILFNLAGALFYADLLRRLAPGTGLLTFCLLVSQPAFLLFSRMAGEVYALNGFLFSLSLWCFFVPGRSSHRRFVVLGSALTGIFSMLLLWNHLVAIPVVIPLWAIWFYLLHRRGERTATQALLAGLVVGSLPWAYGAIITKASSALPFYGGPLSPLAAVQNFGYALGGDGLYSVMAGKVSRSFVWVYPLLAVAVLFVGGLRAERKRPLLFSILALVSLSAVGAWLITPADRLGFRTWLLPLWLVPAAMALGLQAFSNPVRGALASVAIGVNVLSFWVNAVVPIKRTGGMALEQVYEGGRWGTPCEYVDARGVAQRLAEEGGRVLVEDVNVYRFAFLFPKEERHRVSVLSEKRERPDWIVMFRIESRRHPERTTEVLGLPVVWREDLSTPNHLVFAVRKETAYSSSPPS